MEGGAGGVARPACLACMPRLHAPQPCARPPIASGRRPAAAPPTPPQRWAPPPDDPQYEQRWEPHHHAHQGWAPQQEHQQQQLAKPAPGLHQYPPPGPGGWQGEPHPGEYPGWEGGPQQHPYAPPHHFSRPGAGQAMGPPALLPPFTKPE
jgi:hypothetical protein